MAGSLKGLDKLILEVLQESNIVEQEAPVAKEKKIEAVAYPKLGITQNWGKPGNKTPELIRDIFGKIEGNTIQAKVDYLTRFFIDECDVNICGKIDSALSGILVLDVLSSVLNDYGASSGGFLFENFMALLAQGTVESNNRNIVDFNIGGDLEDFEKSASLKLIQPTTPVKGSLKLLRQAFERDPSGVNYFIGFKGQDLTSVELYQFTLTPENFEDMVDIKDTQFVVKKDKVTERRVATLSGLSPENLSRSAKMILDSIDQNVGIIYSNLKLLSDSMTSYFINNDTSAGSAAIRSADVLKVSVEKVID